MNVREPIVALVLAAAVTHNAKSRSRHRMKPVATILGLLICHLACRCFAEQAERVEFTRNNETKQVTGKVVVEAKDGGLLLLATDGVLWSIQPDELSQREVQDYPFRLDEREELIESLRSEFPHGFSFHNTAHYVICYNTSKAYAQWCGSLYERLFRGFMNYWRTVDLREPPSPLIALVFDGKESYAEYARSEIGDGVNTIIGYYSFRTNRIVTYDLTGIERLGVRRRATNAARINQILAQPAAVPLVATVVHEATHQIAFNSGLHQRFADIPLWVSEGMAVYFETPDLRSSRGWRGIGTLNRPRLARLRKYAKRRPNNSILTLIVNDSRFRDPRQAVDAYAEAWGLCYFLLRVHREEFIEYVRALQEKRAMIYDSPQERLALFEESFGVELDELQQSFYRYILNLR